MLCKVSRRTEFVSYSNDIKVFDLVKETELHFLILRVSKLFEHKSEIESRSS